MAGNGDFVVGAMRRIYPSKLMLITLFLICAFGFIVYQRTHKLRVFVLHSYHPTMTWVEGLELGLAQVFAKRRYVDMRYFYMDTKQRRSSTYLTRISRDAMMAIKQYKPDVLIVFDINAQKLVAKKLVNNPNYKVVLAGITDSNDLVEFSAAGNITGVLEKIPVKAIQEVLALMLPKSKKVFYLSDDSPSAEQLDRDISHEDWGKFSLIAHKKVKSFEQWQQEILSAQSRADVILISTYQTVLDKKKHISAEKLVEWTQSHSKVPVIGLYESFINDGGYLAISVASFEQGYTAAKIALFLLEKRIEIKNIPFIRSQMFQLQLRKQKVLKYYPQITIPVILEAFSKTKWQLDDVTIRPLEGTTELK